MWCQCVFHGLFCCGNVCFLYGYFIWLCLCIFIQHTVRSQIPHFDLLACQVSAIQRKINIRNIIFAVINNCNISISFFIFGGNRLYKRHSITLIGTVSRIPFYSLSYLCGSCHVIKDGEHLSRRCRHEIGRAITLFNCLNDALRTGAKIICTVRIIHQTVFVDIRCSKSYIIDHFVCDINSMSNRTHKLGIVVIYTKF